MVKFFILSIFIAVIMVKKHGTIARAFTIYCFSYLTISFFVTILSEVIILTK